MHAYLYVSTHSALKGRVYELDSGVIKKNYLYTLHKSFVESTTGYDFSLNVFIEIAHIVRIRSFCWLGDGNYFSPRVAVTSALIHVAQHL